MQIVLCVGIMDTIVAVKKNKQEMQQYLYLLNEIKTKGVKKSDRTGTGTLSIFGPQIKFDLSEGFPLITTKKIHLKSVIHEMLWFIKGDTNIKYLNDNGVTIWDEWSQMAGDYPNDNRLNMWVKIKPVIDYIDYNGDFSTYGIDAKKGSIDDKLRNSWVKMMKRCYLKSSHNYKSYGGVGVFVDYRWHDVYNFINDVKKLQNWDLKLQNWNDYELDKDYYGSKYYSRETCVWLHTSEKYIYIGNPIEIDMDGQKTIYHSYKDAENKTGIPSTTLHRWCTHGITNIKKGNNKKYNIKSISEIFKEGYVYRKSFTTGELGPVYGKKWVDWVSYKPVNYIFDDTKLLHRGLFEIIKVNQLDNLINSLRNNPNDRRMIVSAWDPTILPESGKTFSENVANDKAALPPCHLLFQCWVGNGKLSLKMYIRSWDYFLGGPFNIAGYALLLLMLAQVSGLEPGDLIITAGDAHLYLNHLEQVDLQLSRKPRKLPIMNLNPAIKNIYDFTYDDFYLSGYDPHPSIKAPISV